MNMPCSNTFYLNQYEIQQDNLYRQHLSSLEEKRMEVVNLCKDVLNGQGEDHLSIWYRAFEPLWNDEKEDYDFSNTTDEECAEMCLEAVVEVLYNFSLDYLLEDNYPLRVLIEDVLE